MLLLSLHFSRKTNLLKNWIFYGSSRNFLAFLLSIYIRFKDVWILSSKTPFEIYSQHFLWSQIRYLIWTRKWIEFGRWSFFAKQSPLKGRLPIINGAFRSIFQLGWADVNYLDFIWCISSLLNFEVHYLLWVRVFWISLLLFFFSFLL